MSGGQLVVLDRLGREVKQFKLSSGLATLGSDPSCDIRILLPTVEPHHATIAVHTNQTVIRNVGAGETLVNGVVVSVAALREGDELALGGRRLRWLYARPAPHHARTRPQSPALQRVRRARGAGGNPGRRSDTPPPRVPHAHHRDSMPATVSTRQVAIVQPQRRDTADRIEAVSSSTVSNITNMRRPRTSKSEKESDISIDKSEEEKGKSKSPKTPQMNLQNTTKATLWIESRKTSPRKSVKENPSQIEVTPRKVVSAKKSTPLRMAVLKKAQSAQKMRVTKIEAPLTIGM
ncbi:unnamed protein product [Parnassius mnemosyne]|uniref:FHA domain-containing protein n=1 Tax=Parnassius mnemosyne TaxID=213953 RepID=A0AAV1LJ27_9NEOP